MSSPWPAWLRRVRHDLAKRLLWPARDRRELGGAVRAGELVVTLVDDEGRPATAETVWAGLRAEAPTPEHPALQAFEPALLTAVAAAAHDDLPAVLALEAAFDRLAHDLAEED
jgi:hypothetical protein